MNNRHLLFGSILLLFATVASASGLPETGHAGVIRYHTVKAFADVVFELNFAITEQNFRITGRNTIGAGLRERGYENFSDVEVIHFCSLELAREVLLLDPGFVAQMPCRITVHENDTETVISVIMLPTDHVDERINAFARRMNATLKAIGQFPLQP